MPALGLVEWRDAYEAVHADLTGEQTKGIIPADTEGCGLDARFFTRLIVVERGAETLTLRPAQIHAHEHLRPVLRLRAACAGMNSDDGVARIVVTTEQRF